MTLNATSKRGPRLRYESVLAAKVASDQYERLRTMADENDETISQVTRRAIKMFLAVTDDRNSAAP